MKKLGALVLACVLAVLAVGCSKGSNQVGGDKLLKENPRARHYDKEEAPAAPAPGAPAQESK